MRNLKKISDRLLEFLLGISMPDHSFEVNIGSELYLTEHFDI